MSDGVTSIDKLPANPQGNTNSSQPVQQQYNLGENQNIKIENYGQQLNNERGNDKLATIDYSSQLNLSLQQASAAGATVLPSRDIPHDTLAMQQDDRVKPNFVPKNSSDDYIGDILNKERILQETNKKQNTSDNIDYFYDMVQLPIVVGIIYFLFQLPVVRKQFLSFLPGLFNNDGNPKLSGYIFNSVIFASLYAGIVNFTNYII